MTPITRKHLSRRTLLKGVGATVALPLLDAMTPALARANGTRPLRLAFTYIPNGVTMEQWTPKALGAREPSPDSISCTQRVIATYLGDPDRPKLETREQGQWLLIHF